MLKKFTDDRGNLTPLEFKDVPFIPQRLFIVKDVPPGTQRGGHAHYCTEQFLICLRGKIRVVLHDGINEESRFITEGETILIDRLVWDYQEFTSDQDILLVLCSTVYNPEDYITDFEKFKLIRGQ